MWLLSLQLPEHDFTLCTKKIFLGALGVAMERGSHLQAWKSVWFWQRHDVQGGTGSSSCLPFYYVSNAFEVSEFKKIWEHRWEYLAAELSLLREHICCQDCCMCNGKMVTERSDANCQIVPHSLHRQL